MVSLQTKRIPKSFSSNALAFSLVVDHFYALDLYECQWNLNKIKPSL